MKLCLIPIFLFALVSGAAAQQTEPVEAAGLEQAAAPPTLIGQDIPRGLQIEGAGPNYVSGGISITQMFSDNAELTFGQPVSDLSYEIIPHMALVHSTTRLSYDLDAMAGFVVNRTLNERNRATESGAADLTYRLSQFVTLRLSDSFMNTTGLWSGLNPGAISAGSVGAMQQPNNSVFTYEHFRTNSALGELTAQLSTATFAGIRGSHSYTWFPNGASSPLTGPLYDGQFFTAEAFYNHHFTVRNWAGITLRGQRFDLERSEGHTDTGSVMFLYGLNIRPNASITFFAGPELSVTSAAQGIAAPSTTFPRRLWSPATGAVFGWQGHKTTTGATFTRQINSSGGLASAVTLTSVSGSVLRQFGRHVELGPAFAYAESAPIIETQTIRTYSGLIQFTYHLRNKYMFSGGYGRDEQQAVATNHSASADRVWISFCLDFVRPLGR